MNLFSRTRRLVLIVSIVIGLILAGQAAGSPIFDQDAAYSAPFASPLLSPLFLPLIARQTTLRIFLPIMFRG